MTFMDQLIADVRKKQEFIFLDEDFIRDHAKEYLRLHPKARELESLEESKLQRNALYKEIIKDVRAKSRKIYGIFQKDAAKRSQLLKEQDIDGLLLTHLSTRERINDYPALYARIAKEADCSSIMDLACGFNPLSMRYMEKKPKHYVAVELSKDDATLLQQGFVVLGIKGEAYAIDLAKQPQKVAQLPHCSVCFLFKALDALEAQRRNLTYTLLPLIPADTLIVSFTTVNVKQQPLLRPQRSWFEKVCNRTGFAFTTFTLGNELFYVCRKA